MLTNVIRETVQQLEPFEHLQTCENNEIVQAWTLESQNRLEAVKAGKLDLIEYNELKRRIS